MRPYIRKYNYISDFYSTVYDIYTNVYQAYPISYYSVDWEYSKDQVDKKLMAASYEKMGIGPLSGIRWKKIQMLPVYNIEQIQPSYTADERGLTMMDTEMTSISFPTSYGIKPVEWDVVHFSQAFMNRDIDLKPLFVVKNVELATFGDLTLYKLMLKVAPYNLADLEESQISERLMFLEFTKQIYDTSTAEILLKMQQRSDEAGVKLYDTKHITGLYIQEMETS